MNGVRFGLKHSYNEWGLMLVEKPVISPPKPQIKLVKVPGSDTVIDLTESLTGSVQYETRKITCEFVIIGKKDRWAKTYTDILAQLHGKRMQITMDDDPNYYYTGRVTVGDMSCGVMEAKLSITAEVEPYKHERHGKGAML